MQEASAIEAPESLEHEHSHTGNSDCIIASFRRSSPNVTLQPDDLFHSASYEDPLYQVDCVPKSLSLQSNVSRLDNPTLSNYQQGVSLNQGRAHGPFPQEHQDNNFLSTAPVFPDFDLPNTNFSPSSAGVTQNEMKITAANDCSNAENVRLTPVLYSDSLKSLEKFAKQDTEALRNKGKSKSSHNVIEQRYRNKINDKFTALQHSVPTLRAVSESKDNMKLEFKTLKSDLEDDSYTSDKSISLEGLEPATKLNKGTILFKTIEYIKFLENKNKSLTMEHQQILSRARMLGLKVDEYHDTMIRGETSKK